ncbi:hypothetical protein AK812_SmicGene6373 [Symbiodinium microadriaticum]|uniref:Uncharacterized protein n=1 Tax=Symbiodinium microadriaticum TaxID=2951 RepID=A0A1Q9ER90_SYMMI|nr:hypothetical protein AK812_SmicGene6373 [Symbiodinium microadriaticum]
MGDTGVSALSMPSHLEECVGEPNGQFQRVLPWTGLVRQASVEIFGIHFRCERERERSKQRGSLRSELK